IISYRASFFYNLKHGERKKFVTWRRQRWIYRKCNEDDYGYLLRDKDEINKLFDEYLKRDWIISNRVSFQDFLYFTEKNPNFIAKPIHGTEGEGIYKFESLNDTQKKEIFTKYNNKNYLFEKYIIQHNSIAELHPFSVNTVRVSTVRNSDGVNIMSASLRIGRHKSIKDNYTTGGLVAAIDLPTGIIKMPAVDKMHNKYIIHPDTNKKIIGLKIPYWSETQELVKQLGAMVPQIRYTGWDISITNNGPVLIEGNYRGNFHVQQHSDMEGKYKIYKEAIKKI
ncbi:MAG TPA: hypothetical protein GX531_07325, partial [Methanothermobacter sp.]|nr:hypothetical protein [Methanothermobacter sp.]